MADAQDLHQIEYRHHHERDLSPVASSMTSKESQSAWDSLIRAWVRHPHSEALSESACYQELSNGRAALAWRYWDARAVVRADGSRGRPLVSRVLVGQASVLTPEVALATCWAGLSPDWIGPLPSEVPEGSELPVVNGDALATLVHEVAPELDRISVAQDGLQAVVAAALSEPSAPLAISGQDALICKPLRESVQCPLLWGLRRIAGPLLGPVGRGWSFSTFELALGEMDPKSLPNIVFREAQDGVKSAPLRYRREVKVRPFATGALDKGTSYADKVELAGWLVAEYRQRGGDELGRFIAEVAGTDRPFQARLDRVDKALRKSHAPEEPPAWKRYTEPWRRPPATEAPATGVPVSEVPAAEALDPEAPAGKVPAAAAPAPDASASRELAPAQDVRSRVAPAEVAAVEAARAQQGDGPLADDLAPGDSRPDVGAPAAALSAPALSAPPPGEALQAPHPQAPKYPTSTTQETAVISLPDRASAVGQATFADRGAATDADPQELARLRATAAGVESTDAERGSEGFRAQPPREEGQRRPNWQEVQSSTDLAGQREGQAPPLPPSSRGRHPANGPSPQPTGSPQPVAGWPSRPADQVRVSSLLRNLELIEGQQEFEFALDRIHHLHQAGGRNDHADRARSWEIISNSNWYENISEHNGFRTHDLAWIFFDVVIPELAEQPPAEAIARWALEAPIPMVDALLAAAKQAGPRFWNIAMEILEPALAYRWTRERFINEQWDHTRAVRPLESGHGGQGRPRRGFLKKR